MIIEYIYQKDYKLLQMACPQMTEALDRVYISTGTVGDVAPFIAHAKQAQASGLSVILLSNSNHRGLAERHGIRFEAVSEPDWHQSNRDECAFFANVVLPGYNAAHESIARMLEAGVRPHVFGRTGNWAAQFICEKQQLQYTRIALQPCAIRQNGHPVSVRELAGLNGLRERMKLPLLPQGMSIFEKVESTLSFFPDWYGKPQSDWLESGECTGFIYLDDDSYSPDGDLYNFVTSRRPVVVSMGTGNPAPSIFDRLIERITSELSLPVVFLNSASEGASFTRAEDLTICRGWADHKFLLSRSRLLIHNGGIGAVAQAIRAHIPQIVVPLIWDQPDNGLRVEHLGLGRCIAPADVASSDALEIIANLLAANGSARP